MCFAAIFWNNTQMLALRRKHCGRDTVAVNVGGLNYLCQKPKFIYSWVEIFNPLAEDDSNQ
jgi:hypothetical protein